MENLAQLEALCERLYKSQDSAERAYAENTLRSFSQDTNYMPQLEYILENARNQYAVLFASSSLLKHVTDNSLPLQQRLQIRNFFPHLHLIIYHIRLSFIFTIRLCCHAIHCSSYCILSLFGCCFKHTQTSLENAKSPIPKISKFEANGLSQLIWIFAMWMACRIYEIIVKNLTKYLIHL